MVMFLAGLLMGVAIPQVTNPRMMLGAHTGTLMTGTFLIVTGLAWKHVLLAPTLERVGVRVLAFSSWGISAALVWAAILGTSRSTPIMGAGYAGSPWAETVADVVLTVSSVALLAAVVIVVRGLFGQGADVLPSEG